MDNYLLDIVNGEGEGIDEYVKEINEQTEYYISLLEEVMHVPKSKPKPKQFIAEATTDLSMMFINHIAKSINQGSKIQEKDSLKDEISKFFKDANLYADLNKAFTKTLKKQRPNLDEEQDAKKVGQDKKYVKDYADDYVNNLQSKTLNEKFEILLRDLKNIRAREYPLVIKELEKNEDSFNVLKDFLSQAKNDNQLSGALKEFFNILSNVIGNKFPDEINSEDIDLKDADVQVSTLFEIINKTGANKEIYDILKANSKQLQAQLNDAVSSFGFTSAGANFGEKIVGNTSGENKDPLLEGQIQCIGFISIYAVLKFISLSIDTAETKKEVKEDDKTEKVQLNNMGEPYKEDILFNELNDVVYNEFMGLHPIKFSKNLYKKMLNQSTFKKNYANFGVYNKALYKFMIATPQRLKTLVKNFDQATLDIDLNAVLYAIKNGLDQNQFGVAGQRLKTELLNKTKIEKIFSGILKQSGIKEKLSTRVGKAVAGVGQDIKFGMKSNTNFDPQTEQTMEEE